MAEHPNAVMVREAVERYASGDLEGYRTYFADDIVWHVGGNHHLSGDYRGKNALFGYFAKIADLTSGSLKVEVQEVMADDEHCGVFSRVTGEREGRALDVVLAQAFTIDADSKISEYWALADDQRAVDAFWS